MSPSRSPWSRPRRGGATRARRERWARRPPRTGRVCTASQGPKDNPDPHLAAGAGPQRGDAGRAQADGGLTHRVDLRPRHRARPGRERRSRGPDREPDRRGLRRRRARPGRNRRGRQRHGRRDRGSRQPRHDRQGRRRQRQRSRLRPRRRRARRPARVGARRHPRHRERPRLAGRGDHPPHHPAPRQRGEVLLRAGADEDAGPRRPHHGAVHHRGVGPGHRVGSAELDDR